MNLIRHSLSSVIIFCLFSTSLFAQKKYFPWYVLNFENDSRDADMIACDDSFSKHFTTLMNTKEKAFEGGLKWSKIPISKLLEQNTPFAEIGFDAVQPDKFTDQEKEILKEYILRGGFLLFVEDFYPYEQEQFHKERVQPICDFILKELPASDPAFKAGKVPDDHPIFKQVYETPSQPAIVWEMKRNPWSNERKMLMYQDRMVAFFIGHYSYVKNDRWVPESKPYRIIWSSNPKNYIWSVNIYFYAVTQ